MKKSLKLSSIILLAGLFFLIYTSVGFAHTPSPPICNDPVCNIDILDFQFNESAVTIRPPNNVTGESVMVVWFNHGSVDHSVTTGPPGTPDGIIDYTLAPGTNFTINITQSVYNQILNLYSNGSLPYYCKYHYLSFDMIATLTVTGTPIPEFSSPTFLLTTLLLSIILLSIGTRSLKQRSHLQTRR